ncbi:hypothetical protein O9993_08765 [Vibrio lentus]|nr:hypothetical protein [Vibrio lentus]
MGRTEIDTQANGPQGITVEDTFSMVHISCSSSNLDQEHLRSEPAIVMVLPMPHWAAIQSIGIGSFKIMGIFEISLQIRFRGFTDFNQKLENPGGFH